jgi:threonine aldolase
MLDPGAVAHALELAAHHWPEASAVFVENTHMAAGGVPWDMEQLHAVAALGLPVHLDGARLFNAAVATGVDAAVLAAPAVTVMCCLSKGLGAPVGSLLAGSASLMDRARQERKRLGGGMRQAGVLAAPGLIALRDHVTRLADDHARARHLAEAIAERWPGSVEPARVHTNIVVATHPDAAEVLAHLAADGVLAGTVGPGRLRFVTHLDIDDEAITRATKSIATSPC